ncbi:hypothetical protein U472_02785 [Orenia metallireducens]|uniref:Uncharacterized protein n=1 Tax=Orenia metallireducens TaxID=1413210 RepID=A0A1C0ACM6_9FIRM|nr:hypothetical protein [Orenia metallireducens]OCL28132.1 hypothetical protein U472_02785 [Orenia metallireducens]
MKLVINNHKILDFLENRLLILWLVFLLFLSSSGMLVYKIVSFSKNNQQFVQFSNNLDNIIQTSKKVVENREIISEEGSETEVSKETSTIKEYSTKDPFQTLLKKVEKVNLNKLVKSQIAKQPKNNNTSNNPKVKENKVNPLAREIELLGMLNSEISKVAIIKFGKKDSIIQIMKAGEEFAGLRIKEIKDDEVVMESKGGYYIYTLGGDDN